MGDLRRPWRMILWNKWLIKFNSKTLHILDFVPSVTESAIEIAWLPALFLSYMGANHYTHNLGFIMEYIIGYDMAYRLRIQDIMNESNEVRLLINPRRELKRLWKIYERRECVIPTYMLPKARRLFNIMLLLLWIPKVKKAFRKTVKTIEWDKIKFTKEDEEWIKVRVDYKFNG